MSGEMESGEWELVAGEVAPHPVGRRRGGEDGGEGRGGGGSARYCEIRESSEESPR